MLWDGQSVDPELSGTHPAQGRHAASVLMVAET